MVIPRTGAAIALVVLFAGPGAAQDASLKARIDPTTYATIRVILDSAKHARLPTRPIEDKALEGASSGATGPAIVLAVRNFTTQLSTAASTLGREATADELRAAVSAIDAGVPRRDLMRIRSAAPADRSIATALTVASDIIVRGVPVAAATNLVVSLLRAKVKDAELLDFARAIRLDIVNGGDPSTAAAARARGVILIFGSGSRSVTH